MFVFLCPKCRKNPLFKVEDIEGVLWECLCGYSVWEERLNELRDKRPSRKGIRKPSEAV